MPFALDLVPGGGSLLIRDAEEAFPLELPTRLAGTVEEDTGVITGASFTTPQVSFEQEVTSPLSATAFIDATFSQVAPGTASGTIDDQGEMAVDLELTVDLHIEVVPTGATTPVDLPGDCRATPVALNLVSSTPYDPETDEVTLADPDFTVPSVSTDADCSAIIADAVNEQLAGSGHALSLVVEGDIPLPPPAGCATTTALEVTPADGASVGDQVTLDVAVAPVEDDPECQVAAADGVPLVGAVELRDGTTPIATVTLDGSGRASTSTTNLPAGTRTLTARYRGSPPYQTSTSDPTSYAVRARPTITADLPTAIEVGAAPVEFDLTVANTGFGAPIEGARLDLTVRRSTGTGALTAPMVALEVFDGTTWVPMAATGPATRTVLVSIGAVGDFDVAPGSEVTHRVRIAVGRGGPPTPPSGPVAMSFELVAGDLPPAAAPTASPLAVGSAVMSLVGAERTPATITLMSPASGGPIGPHTVRAGSSVTIPSVSLGPLVSGLRPNGFVEVLLDNRPVPSSRAPFVLDPGEMVRHPLNGGGAGTFLVGLPVDLAPGSHTLTVRYSGDAYFEAATVSAPFTVLPPVGAIYECTAQGSPQHRFRAQVVAQANLPGTVAAGSTVDLDHLAVKVLTDRSFLTTNSFSGLLTNDAVNTVGSPATFEGVSFTFGPQGTGTATGIDRRLGTRLPADPNPATVDIDHSLTFLGESGSLVIDGEPGDVVPVTLDVVGIDMRASGLGLPYAERCGPVGDPVLLGEVTVAGVNLTVTPGGTIRAGRSVALSATTAPSASSGVVEFRAGTTTLGVVPVVDGVVNMATTGLATGTHVLTARFFPSSLVPALMSAPVELTVLPALDCEDFAVEGSGAVVRLVYVELLGRCPDQAGFDHWNGRLDGGTSPEVFARTIARTSEAVGRVVDDAYETMLGRAPDAEGRKFWVRSLQASGRYDRLLADLGASGEFWSKAGSTDAGFVNRVYDRLLDRAPDAGGLQYWSDRLAAGASRRSLILTLANLDEPLGRLVVASFDEILSRAPGASERSRAIGELRASGDRSGLYARLIGTEEFTHRAQGFPNPED